MSNLLALYIHWPFCLAKCPYCDFNSHVVEAIDQSKWLEAYMKELSYFKNILTTHTISSIFFGGGTPSLMPPKIINAIIEFIIKNCKTSDNIEITLEANPTSVEASKFIEFKAAGVNRLSLGIQSLNNHDLKILGRQHDATEAIGAIELAQKYFNNYSFDLIYARPKQTLKAWQDELGQALDLAGPHISLYQLTIEKGTPFYKAYNSGNLTLPDNELAAELYDYTNTALYNKDLKRYEISNYAKEGKECQHNLAYWRYQNYLGIGPGSHSRISNKYTQAIMMWHKPNKWLNEATVMGHGIQSQENLSVSEKVQEIVMMGLRITEGINKQRFKRLTGKELIEFFNIDFYKFLISEKLLEDNDNYINLTPKGLNLHNYIMSKLLKDV